MSDALTPREIQARIRAGESVADLVAASGMSPSAIETFAGPVLDERKFIVNQALSGSVRRNGVQAHQSLSDLVSERLASRNLNGDSVTWDAWRLPDRLWALKAAYLSGSAAREAIFHFDAEGLFSVAIDDEARWLISEQSTTHGPQPGRRSQTRKVDSEPTLDLSPTRNIRLDHPLSEDLPLFDGEEFSSVRLTEIDGVYDLVASRDRNNDVLTDMLASINEESVRIYEGIKAANQLPER